MAAITNYIVTHTQLPKHAINNTLQLLDEACTIPFISRYRKERTGNLDEVQIANIVKYKDQFETLEKRKETILKALKEQEVLTAELEQKIQASTVLTTLEDLYLPYKKSRKTKAEKAKQQGLEPLAKIIMAQHATTINALAVNYVKADIKTVEEAIEGARYIIAEWINERSDVRNIIRHQLTRFALITTKAVKSKTVSTTPDANANKFKDYLDRTEALSQIPSHRFLAILRAEAEGFVKVKIQIDDERTLSKIESRIIRTANSSCTDHIRLAIKDAYKRLLLPSLSNEILQDTKAKADDAAILVFAKNLKQLLLGAPIGQKRVLAIDPGFRTGCKVVCLNAQGDLLHNETIYPHAPKNDFSGAIKKISTLSEAYKIEAIAIGNGTASRETEALIKKIHFKTNIQVFVVSEAGASIYSASPIARDEFPNYDVTVRGAVSIGRRLQDPLAELVKIEAKSIGVGQYQHDVDQVKLNNALNHVVENCVNAVGVNINTASKSLLSYVSGIGSKLAENIVAYRNENGAFTSREEIKNVPRLGSKAFEQSAAFLRIIQAANPLDNSAVHPESYGIVEKMAKQENVSVANLIGNTALLKTIDLKPYCTVNVGLPTLKDIIKELEKPGLDIRKQAKVFAFNQDIKTIQDVREGQLLPGIVNNVTNFGAFVDIGIKESGLIHISNLSDSYVSDVNACINLHEQVIVKVLSVDVDRKRIQLKRHK